MRHIDIFLHVICLFSGVFTAFLGYLLYIKYKIKAIKNYSLFILTTTFTVLLTTLNSYFSILGGTNQNYISLIITHFIFGILISIINLTLSLFSLNIINKRISKFYKIIITIPFTLLLITIIVTIFFVFIKKNNQILPLIDLVVLIIVFNLLFSFIFYGILIFINMKFFDNLDLKNALKTLAVIFIIYIPIQFFIITINKQFNTIMLSRNIFYLIINITSIFFAVKYFFVKTPSLMDKIEITEIFVKKYSITEREKEIIELLLSGLSIKEIAGNLNRSFKTVNNHIYNIYQKTKVSSKIELLITVKENMIFSN